MAEEEKQEKIEEEKKGQPTKVPAKFKDFVEQIEKMTVVELNQLVKLLEEKFGVSAAEMAAGPVAGSAGGAGAEEKNAYAVHLKSVGANKIQVIKVLKDALGLGLKAAKDLVDGAPILLKEDARKEEAENIKKAVAEVGGEVELK